jgi:hypothetical protein
MTGHWPCLSVLAPGLGSFFLEFLLPALKLLKLKLSLRIEFKSTVRQFVGSN